MWHIKQPQPEEWGNTIVFVEHPANPATKHEFNNKATIKPANHNDNKKAAS